MPPPDYAPPEEPRIEVITRSTITQLISRAAMILTLPALSAMCWLGYGWLDQKFETIASQGTLNTTIIAKHDERLGNDETRLTVIEQRIAIRAPIRDGQIDDIKTSINEVKADVKDLQAQNAMIIEALAKITTELEDGRKP